MTKANVLKVIDIYRTLKRIMKKYGQIISFPKNTDPSKTYCWRYLTNFLQRYEQLELDESALPNVLEAVVKEAKRRKILKCGIAILTKIDPLDACHRGLEQDIRDETRTLTSVEDSHKFLQTQLGSGQDLLELLIDKPSRRARANIVRWYDSGQLSLAYLAVSRTCKRAMCALSAEETSIFPISREILKVRLRLMSRQPVLERMREVLGTDLFEG